ncbi:MAG: hypothetical protein HYV90_03270 [Candidatus Woesebacteria bacterium]|nr:MAG: hypothetical protein HYV90_03270 [Candidatus Woesebacteria bacterium]
MIRRLPYFLILICFALVFLSPFFIKIKINCKSQFGSCPERVLSRIGVFNGKNLYIAKRNIGKILSSDFTISNYSLQFKLPNILETYIVVKKPFAALVDRNTKIAALVDGDGKILSFGSDSTLPTVTTDLINQSEGQRVTDRDFFALKIIAGVFQMYQIRTGEMDSESLVVELSPQIRVIFPLYGDSDILLGSLRLIYSKISEPDNTGKFSEIDLRFKNAVLR